MNLLLEDTDTYVISNLTTINKDIYMYKQDLALNNLQGLICHKIQPTRVKIMFGAFQNLCLNSYKYIHRNSK